MYLFLILYLLHYHITGISYRDPKLQIDIDDRLVKFMLEGLITHDHFAYWMAYFDPLAGSPCNLYRFGQVDFAIAQSPIAIPFG